MSKTRREQLREETEADIKNVARRQMAAEGAASLSLRAIAREMGLSAPALYRYFDSRDALVTTLIVEAYTDLALAVETAVSSHLPTAHAERFSAAANAYRQWAITHPQDYSLIYGTPIPGYEAPRESTVAPAARVNVAIGTVLATALQDGYLTLPETYASLPDGLQHDLDMVAAYLDDQRFSPAIILLTMSVWSRLHGLVWGELYEHFAPNIADSGELFQVEIETMRWQLGLA